MGLQKKYCYQLHMSTPNDVSRGLLALPDYVIKCLSKSHGDWLSESDLLFLLLNVADRKSENQNFLTRKLSGDLKH